MAAVNSTSSLARQVVEHGEDIVELKTIVKELHENAKTDRATLLAVSNAVIALKARDAVVERIITWGIPLVVGTLGVVVGHLWH